MASCATPDIKKITLKKIVDGNFGKYCYFLSKVFKTDKYQPLLGVLNKVKILSLIGLKINSTLDIKGGGNFGQCCSNSLP